MRQNIHAAVNVAKRFSKDINNADSEALAILGFKNTNRSAFEVTNEEIISQIEDMKERIEAFLYVVKGVHALCEDRDDGEELINIMHGVNRINMYTGEKLEDCDLWEKMIHEHPNNAAAYQAQNFG